MRLSERYLSITTVNVWTLWIILKGEPTEKSPCIRGHHKFAAGYANFQRLKYTISYFPNLKQSISWQKLIQLINEPIHIYSYKFTKLPVNKSYKQSLKNNIILKFG